MSVLDTKSNIYFQILEIGFDPNLDNISLVVWVKQQVVILEVVAGFDMRPG